MLALAMPEMIRPINRIGNVWAKAISMKSRPSARLEARITGRRPKRSDSAPCTGENTNCMRPNSAPMMPVQRTAVAMSPPVMCCTRCGKTGMMMPKASMSIITVTKMKMTAALRTGVWLCSGVISGYCLLFDQSWNAAHAPVSVGNGTGPLSSSGGCRSSVTCSNGCR